VSKSSVVSNRPLSGIELRKIIQDDVEYILAQDGMLANHVAYSRAAYEVTLKLHLDNISYPEHTSKTSSRKASAQELEQDPSKEALESFPLKNTTEESVKKGRERKREINSPNRARIENGIPIQAQVRQPDGTVETKDILYSTDDYPDDVRPDLPVDRDLEGTEV
jgi:hypothetical protein